MQEVPRGLRLHIALVGRSNVGKSSLCNALAGQPVSLVSDMAGTTADPVEKTLELAPLGPVVLLDTAGIDDTGELGGLRAARSLHILRRADVALLVTDQSCWGDEEARLAALLRRQGIPFAVVRNKCDVPCAASASRIPDLPPEIPVVAVSARSGAGLETLRTALSSLVPDDTARPLLSDLLPPHGLVLFVVPLDTGAPRGRLILPQVQAIRDSLDGRDLCLLATERDMPMALASLSRPPDLVVCDSQVVHLAAAAAPPSVPLTTFSILMARFKGDLAAFAHGAAAMRALHPGALVCIQEACSHHPQEDDIARVKLPRLLQEFAGCPLRFCWDAGKEFPAYDRACALVVHCGACVITRGQMLARQRAAAAAGLPMTNYGMAISLAQGVLRRVLSPFPDALAALAAHGLPR